jgi:hypothetical protein
MDRLFMLFKDRMREIIDGKFIDIPLGGEMSELSVVFMVPFMENEILFGPNQKVFSFIISNK